MLVSNFELMSYSQWQSISTLGAKLYSLEEMTVESRVYEAIRQILSGSSRLSDEELHHMVSIGARCRVMVGRGVVTVGAGGEARGCG